MHNGRLHPALDLSEIVPGIIRDGHDCTPRGAGSVSDRFRSLTFPARRSVSLSVVRGGRSSAATAAAQGTRGQSAQGGKCQPAQVAPIESLVVHGSPREEKVLASWLTETGGVEDVRLPFALFPLVSWDCGF